MKRWSLKRVRLWALAYLVLLLFAWVVAEVETATVGIVAHPIAKIVLVTALGNCALWAIYMFVVMAQAGDTRKRETP